MTTTLWVLVILGVLLLLGVVGFLGSAVGRGRQAMAAGAAGARAWAEARGGTFEAGSFGAWSARGDGWSARARATSGAGTRLEAGLNTRFSIARTVRDGVLYVGPAGTDPIEAFTSLLGAPRPLEIVTTGDSAFDEHFVVAVGGLSPALITAPIRAALLAIPPARRPEIVIHPKGIDVLILGPESEPERLDGLSAIAEAIDP